MRINVDYLRGAQEISCFVRLGFRNIASTSASTTSTGGVVPEGKGSVLIISTCLIGEFVASMPALGDFIQKQVQAGKQVDLLVAPSQKPLAERMIGVRSVYTAKPAHGRAIENVAQEKETKVFPVYEKTVALRVSPAAYRALRGVSLGKISISMLTGILYGTHLLLCVLRRRTPTQWRDMNFEFFSAKPRSIPWQEIVAFKEADHAKLKDFDFLSSPEKKILIHSNANWPGKCWEADKWVALLKKIHENRAALGLGECRIIFIGAPDDEANQQYISSRLDFKTYSLVGKINLAELLLVMTQSSYLVGIDSGPSNLAHLADLRSVTVFGPGPHMFLPSNPKDTFVDKSRGRGLYQMFVAKKNNFISKITVDEVYTAFTELVARTQNA